MGWFRPSRPASHDSGTAPSAEEQGISATGQGLFRAHLTWLLVFSIAANLLALAMPIHLAQIYDKVLPSKSMETLFYLTIVILFALALFGLLESLKARIAQRLSAKYELAVAPVLAAGAFQRRQTASADPIGALKDVATVRQTLSSRSFIGLFDLPFAPAFLLILFVVHPLLAWIALGGGLLLVASAVGNEWKTRKRQDEATRLQAEASRSISEALHRADDVHAMGMSEAVLGRWNSRALQGAGGVDAVAALNASFFGLVRFLRQALQIIILGAGAYLVLVDHLSAGLIFAASIVSGKALLPIENVIGGWRQLATARSAYRRVEKELATRAAPDRRTMRLKAPKGVVDVAGIGLAAGGDITRKPVLAGISFSAQPGQILVIVGPSGAGKSTLLRILSGSLSATAGHVRVDGFDLVQWNREQLGRHTGYVGQDIAFFDGTIAENIARFVPDATDEEIIEAAELAGAHEFVGTLADGYNTVIGQSGIRLSGGQRQRIALARAFFRDPEMLLLDEPDAHLDSQGEAALRTALAAARDRGRTIVVVTQRTPLLEICDQVLLLRDGRVAAFGPARDVLKPKVVQPAPGQIPAHAVKHAAPALGEPGAPPHVQAR
ncbi:Type I secretion system ATP-binding protein PrsD [Hartmannibacter diazotrophicus]|uniref:Type I secretion system ATP-binding protein PrsD n=2 Tax=Hartmannibacter diazotrophicus TaxID=1482074 RepID=A0A2C9D7I0_9HYPH|nr:type I secretion system permease/ATPase [Hartmannibacter diazotrophicus]SON55495.1 Type I secretion system ATP-binding protein PrsD [Hartmannibacter diazotrophicus]